MSVELCKKTIGAEEHIADNLQIMGSVYTQLGNFEKAYTTLQEALVIIQKTKESSNTKRIMAKVYAELGELYLFHYLHKKDGEIAKIYKEKTLLTVAGGMELFYHNKVIPQGVSCKIAQYRWLYGRTILYYESDYNSALEWFNDAEYIAEQQCPKDLFIKGRISGSVAKVHLRQNKLTEAYEGLTKAISLLNILLGNESIILYKSNRAEVNIRLGKFQEAYEDAIFVKTFNKICHDHLTRLSVISSIYHSYFAQYKLNNYKKSIEHFVEFTEKAQDFCKSFLEQDQYDELVKEGVFNVMPYVERAALNDIKIYLHNSLKVFTAIYDSEHYFVKNYIEPNYLEAIK